MSKGGRYTPLYGRAIPVSVLGCEMAKQVRNVNEGKPALFSFNRVANDNSSSDLASSKGRGCVNSMDDQKCESLP